MSVNIYDKSKNDLIPYAGRVANAYTKAQTDAKIEEATNSISDKWDSAKRYVKGDYAIDENIVWKCLADNTGVKPSEGTYWTACSVTSEIKLVNENLNRLFIDHTSASDDLNNIEANAISYVSNSTRNNPTSFWGFVMFLTPQPIPTVSGATFGTQIFYPMNPNANSIHIRQLDNGSWSAWKRIDMAS